MSTPQPEVATRDQYLAEANAELDAMLGEVGELDASRRRQNRHRDGAGCSWS